MQIERAIFSQLVFNQEYFARVIPHLKPEYFQEKSQQIILKIIKTYADKYKSVPNQNALKICVDKINNLTESDYVSANDLIDNLTNAPEDLEFVVDETEKYCQQQAMYNALHEALIIKENFDKPLEQRDRKVKDIGMIPEIMRDALGVCFDTSVGHDFFEDWDSRWTKYSERINKLPFTSVSMLNTITNGGVERGTLNIILAGVNVGKSLGLCNLAADYLMQGYNVLYISMEMAEHVVAKRIDANLINISMDNFESLGLNEYSKRIQKKKEQVGNGKLIIKQYPTAGAHVGHFNGLLNELRTKKSFIPDIVIVDYLGICASSRIRGGSDNSYTLVKSIAEELRGFAVEHNVAVWSAAQTTRGAWGASDINMEDTAESAGLPATADFMIAVMETDETIEMGQQRVKQIKSRYADKSVNSAFMIGVDKGLQRWSDVQTGMNTAPAKTSTSQSEPSKPPSRAPKVEQDYSNVDLGTGEIKW